MRWRRVVVLTTAMAIGVAGASTATSGYAAPSERSAAAPAGLGTWQVRTQGGDEQVIRWTSERRLPVRSSRPEIVDAAGRPLGVTSIVADGRAVEVRITGPVPDVEELDVLLAGDRLDEPGVDRPAAARPGTNPSAPRARLADDPGAAGDAPVISSDYQLDALPLRGMPAPIEMVGHVVEPAPGAVSGDKPLVLFLHGRHDWCYTPKAEEDFSDTWPCAGASREVPSERGYDYLQRLLASQGYVTVSIRANGINAQDWRLPDGGAGARADLIAAHLRHWASLAGTHEVDLSRVVLVGHSRGGEGVDRFSLRPPDETNVVGQVLLAPTNFGDQRSSYVPTVTVLPYCDGDVSDLQGQRYVDAARELEPDDPALRSSVLLMGANHNYFNTEWTPGISAAPSMDDWGGRAKQYCGAKHPQRLSAAQQRDAAAVLVGGAVRLFAERDEASLPLFDGSPVTTSTLAPALTWSAALAGDRDTRYPGPALRATAGEAGTVRTCRAVMESAKTACGRGAPESTPSWPAAEQLLPEVDDLEIAWQHPGTAATLALAEPLDLRDRRLQLRVIQDPRRETARFSVRATDGAGRTADLVGAPASLATLPGSPENARRWARTVTFTAPSELGDLDLADVRSLELVTGSGKARIWLRDVSSVGTTLPAVPTHRPATIQVGSVRVPEGDGPSPGVALVPWTVTGDVGAGARFRAVVQGPRRATKIDIDVPPGTTSGTIPVRFPRNTTHEDYRVAYEVAAHTISGANVEAYLGRAVIIDDDPAPRVRARVKKARVREGGSIKVVLRLSTPVTEARYYQFSFVKAPGRGAQVGDLGAAWRKRVYLSGPETGLLSDAEFVGTLKVRRGADVARLRIPVARDGRPEGTESVRIRVRGKGVKKTLTVRLLDR